MCGCAVVKVRGLEIEYGDTYASMSGWSGMAVATRTLARLDLGVLEKIGVCICTRTKSARSLARCSLA